MQRAILHGIAPIIVVRVHPFVGVLRVTASHALASVECAFLCESVRPTGRQAISSGHDGLECG